MTRVHYRVVPWSERKKNWQVIAPPVDQTRGHPLGYYVHVTHLPSQKAHWGVSNSGRGMAFALAYSAFLVKDPELRYELPRHYRLFIEILEVTG